MIKQKVVISGINGFVGHHLARELDSAGIAVIGIGLDAVVDSDITDIVSSYYQSDLSATWPNIPNVTAVIHLAGLAAVGPSFDNPQKYINVNSSMVTNLCEYYLKQAVKPRIVVVSSGAIYSSNQSMPISEAGEIGFSSPYAVSKILNENQVTYYRNRGLDCVVARPFNHIGPGQKEGFILPDFYSRLSQLDSNEQQTIQTGNIETRRDYTDVRDIARAYSKLALAPKLDHIIYNICSGVSLSGREILDELKTAMKLPNIQYETDPSLVRPTDAMEIIGDASRLKSELDWVPLIDIHQTVLDFVQAQS